MSFLAFLSFALSAVFVVSGWQKFRGPVSARAAAIDLGIPPELVKSGFYPLCVGEVALAAGLLIKPLHAAAVWLSLGLLIAFTALVTVNLIRATGPRAPASVPAANDRSASAPSPETEF